MTPTPFLCSSNVASSFVCSNLITSSTWRRSRFGTAVRITAFAAHVISSYPLPPSSAHHRHRSHNIASARHRTPESGNSCRTPKDASHPGVDRFVSNSSFLTSHLRKPSVTHPCHSTTITKPFSPFPFSLSLSQYFYTQFSPISARFGLNRIDHVHPPGTGAFASHTKFLCSQISEITAFPQFQFFAPWPIPLPAPSPTRPLKPPRILRDVNSCVVRVSASSACLLPLPS